jgi:hypothetical protein
VVGTHGFGAAARSQAPRRPVFVQGSTGGYVLGSVVHAAGVGLFGEWRFKRSTIQTLSGGVYL